MLNNNREQWIEKQNQSKEELFMYIKTKNLAISNSLGEFALVLPCDENSDDMLPRSYNWQMVKNLDIACYAFLDLSSIFIRCLAYELLNNGANLTLFINKNYQLSLFKGVHYGY